MPETFGDRLDLYGKFIDSQTNKLASGCLTLTDCYRTLYLKPASATPDLAGIVQAAMEQGKVTKAHRSALASSPMEPPSLVSRKAVFDLGGVLPRHESPYVKMSIPASVPAAALRTVPGVTRVLGAGQSLLEALILQNALPGPCWLRIESAVAPGILPEASHVPSAFLRFAEARVSVKSDNAPPPLRVLALGVDAEDGRLRSLGALVCDEFPIAGASPKAEAFRLAMEWKKASGNEARALQALQALLRTVDMVVGHALDDADGDLALCAKRAAEWVEHEAAGARVRLTLARRLGVTPARASGKRTTPLLPPGVILADTLKQAKEHMPPQRDYSLEALTREPPESASSGLRRAELALKLALNLETVSLSYRLTAIGGNLWRRTLAGGRAERIEYLLLHAFTAAGFVVPDKGRAASSGGGGGGDDDGKAAVGYVGGKVLEPKKGIHKTLIAVLDYASLYPSIIMEHKICFSEKDSVLPSVIEGLVRARQDVRREMKTVEDEAARAQLDVQQKALKITANSMYGCLGFPASRFYAKHLAAEVTRRGRELLDEAVRAAGEEQLEVIYGDTDSILIDTKIAPAQGKVSAADLERAKDMAKRVEDRVNPAYRQIRLATDSILCPLLLLNKKKYGAVAHSSSKGGEVKSVTHVRGLDLVRRDWCLASRGLCTQVLDILLDFEGNEPARVVAAVSAFGAKAKDLPLSQWVVAKQLTKNIDDYKSLKGKPHLVLARLKADKGVSVSKGDQIPYVICTVPRPAFFEGEQLPMAKDEGGEADGDEDNEDDAADETSSDSSFSYRAFSPDEFLQAKGLLKLDLEWYMTKQILPPVLRLIDPIADACDLDALYTALGLPRPRRAVKKKA